MFCIVSCPKPPCVFATVVSPVYNGRKLTCWFKIPRNDSFSPSKSFKPFAYRRANQILIQLICLHTAKSLTLLKILWAEKTLSVALLLMVGVVKIPCCRPSLHGWVQKVLNGMSDRDCWIYASQIGASIWCWKTVRVTPGISAQQ